MKKTDTITGKILWGIGWLLLLTTFKTQSVVIGILSLIAGCMLLNFSLEEPFIRSNTEIQEKTTGKAKPSV